MYGPPRHTPIQSEAELQRERAELKAWRKRKVETLAARRRAVRVLRGDLTSPPNARIGRKRRKALGGRAPPPTPSQPTDATVETPARALTSPLTSCICGGGEGGGLSGSTSDTPIRPTQLSQVANF